MVHCPFLSSWAGSPLLDSPICVATASRKLKPSLELYCLRQAEDNQEVLQQGAWHGQALQVAAKQKGRGRQWMRIGKVVERARVLA